MRVHVMELQSGDRLTADTYNSFGLHVLSAETLLNGEDISNLIRHNIDYVDILRRISQDSPSRSLTSVEIFLDVQKQYDHALANVKELYEQAQKEGRIQDRIVKTSFEPLIETFIQVKDVVSLLLTINNNDDYTYQHSVQVGMLSYFITKWLGESEADALMAGKAGYLHDIGKCKISPEILNKPDKLTAIEYEEVKKHTLYGYEIVKKSILEPAISLAALQHHERLNGTGYPHSVKGDKMHTLSKIVAVADIYSAMISSRVYQQGKDLLTVLKELYRLSFTELDPKVCHVFIKNMIPNFIGKQVYLNNNQTGTIVLTNPNDFFRPLIQIDEQFIDLSEQTELQIEKIHT